MSGKVMPSQQELREALARCSWVRLTSVSTRESYPGLPLELRDEAAVSSLRTCLAIEERPEKFRCMCAGDFAIELHDEAHALAVLSFHHGVSIRWDRWNSDACLHDGPRLLEWLASVGVTRPLESFREDERRAEEAAAAEARWLAAMPACLRSLWTVDDFGQVDVGPLRAALGAAIPNDDERILVVLRWFGSGAGPWSGFPSYEAAAEELLLEYPTPELLGAVAQRELSPVELEGAVRLFAGWSFGKQRPRDRRLIPAALRARLLEHALHSQDEDKRARARSALR